MKNEITLYGLIMLIVSGTVLSTLVINALLINYGVTNDYVFSNLQNISEQLQKDAMYGSDNVSNLTLFIGQTYQQSINWFDNLWFLVYVIFIIITFAIAYRIKRPTEINFFLILLYGIFIFLFVVYLTDIFVNWFLNNITFKLLHNAFEYFPKFEWYINHAVLINLFHSLLLLIISRVNFQFSQRQEINDQELESFDGEEIV